jgi:hypothetical protein
MPSEKLRHNDSSSGPDAHSDAFPDHSSNREGRVDVVHGVYAHSLPLAGMTVHQARHHLEDRMNIAPDAVAVVDGRESDEDSVLDEGQVLTFVKHAGEKG